MKRNGFVVTSIALVVLLLSQKPIRAQSVSVRVMFNPASPDVGPFPTDALTVSDSAQKTGLRVNLPRPDCSIEPSTCDEIGLVNQLDGFSIEPRLRIRFSGPVDPRTLRSGIFLVWLDDLTNEEVGLQPFGHVTVINSVSYDPATNTAFAEPDEILSQHRRYALVVTNAVRNRTGEPVVPDPSFLACIGRQEGYCEQLAAALPRVAMQDAGPRLVVGGSVFTTMSITPWLERARGAIQDSAIGFQRPTPNSVFAVADLSALALKAEMRAGQPLTSVPLPILPKLQGVSRIAFGSFWSPNFLDAHQVIAGVPTAADVAAPLVSAQILFHVYLPTGPAPAAGFPVVIVGHGVGGERFSATANIAAAMAAKGVAVIGVNAVGHGYGPQTKLALTDKSGATVEIAAPGRAVDLNHDGAYGAAEGCALTAPPYAFGYRDCSRQTALDIMQLVRAIRAGMDLDGDGSLDLDPERIYYAGFSQGAMFGAVLMAVEPHIEAATLTSGAGSIPDTWRWVREGPSWAGAVAAMSLRKPTLFNVGTQNFDYDWPLRDKPVHIISVPGAIALQEYLERAAWVMMPGDALGYAPHLQASPLPGVPAKRVLFQFGIGDTTLPNPCESNLVRAAKMRETTSVYRHDLARATVFGADLPRNPHGLFASATTASGMVIARAAQRQMAEFLASGLAFVPDVNAVVVPYFGISLFGIPEALPEELNYLP